MQKFKRFWNAEDGEQEDEENVLTQIYDGTTLSWSTRIKAFAMCFVIGCLLSLLSTICLAFPSSNSLKLFAVLYSFGNLIALSGVFFLLIPGEASIRLFAVFYSFGNAVALCSVFFLLIPGEASISLFAVFYSFGNAVALCSTMFLMGPVNQLKNMFKEKRIVATLIALLFLGLTLCAALWWDIAIIAIIFCCCQFLAFIWYSLSYIPYARDAVRKCICACIE